MTENNKIKEIESKGWYQYYSKTHWVTCNIFKYYKIIGQCYFGNEHTNHQFDLSKAIEIQKVLDNETQS